MRIQSSKKMNSTFHSFFKQIFFGALISVAGVALAAGSLDLWTAESGYIYIDENYVGAGASVESVVIPGSVTENIEIRVSLPAGAGSLSEDTRYVGLVSEGTELPVSVQLSEADAEWLPTSGPKGNLDMETGDRELIKGKLFTYPINANAVDIGQ